MVNKVKLGHPELQELLEEMETMVPKDQLVKMEHKDYKDLKEFQEKMVVKDQLEKTDPKGFLVKMEKTETQA